MSEIRLFQIAIPQSTLDVLNKRLSRTRWADQVAGAGWNYGTDMTFIKELATYWQNGYDWRKQEAALNRFAQFKTTIDGVEVHFIHERGKGTNPQPLLLIHGWPDSFYRFHKVIPMLTDPASYGGDPNQSFDVIVPSIPGTGFSDHTVLNDEANGDLFVKLMTEVLGYPKFISAGGDHGALITLPMAHRHPEVLKAIHLTDVGYPNGSEDFSKFSPAEMEMTQWVQKWFMEDGAYNMIQATKPQTLAFSFNDSPVGLASWIIGCASSGKMGREEFPKRFSKDELLTNIMIYWVTQTIGSSMQAYFVGAHTPSTLDAGHIPSLPAGVAHCPYDPPLPRAWAERKVNVVHFTEFPRGGHFMAWEEPELYANDIRTFVQGLDD
jgi:pimeloyl-ACP methyl ester carboxylesterase